jgi:hypothetical protein
MDCRANTARPRRRTPPCGRPGRSCGRLGRRVSRPRPWHMSPGDRKRQRPAPAGSGGWQGWHRAGPDAGARRYRAPSGARSVWWCGVLWPWSGQSTPGHGAERRHGPSTPGPPRCACAPRERRRVPPPRPDALGRRSAGHSPGGDPASW